MVHSVLMKFQPGKLNDNALQELRAGYTQIQHELQEHVRSVHLWQNCVERDQNMDLMIQLELNAPEALQVYLHHPQHVALIQKYQPDILSIVSFDREDK